MSDETSNTETETNEDAFADGISAIIAVVIPWLAVIYWLAGLPRS